MKFWLGALGLTLASFAGAASDPVQQRCDGRALIGQAASEARLSGVPRDQYKLNLIEMRRKAKPGSFFHTSIGLAYKDIDWVYREKWKPQETYLQVFKACATENGRQYTLSGETTWR